MLRTILVPLDGSRLAERALESATAIAASTGARLILMRAVAETERFHRLANEHADGKGWPKAAEAHCDAGAERLTHAGVVQGAARQFQKRKKRQQVKNIHGPVLLDGAPVPGAGLG